MPSFFVPARDSRHRAACLALYRALLRQIPHVSLPAELTSRPGWINPLRYLVRTGFQRNKTDTSPRLVTSALTSGYRFLSLLARARKDSSRSHAEVVSFLLDRHRAFPPPRSASPAPSEPAKPRVPLLTKVSAPGEKPLYASTVRPLPLSQLSGGKRKVPQLENAQHVPFLRIGKPQSHAHANYLRAKIERRQSRLTTIIEMIEQDRSDARFEDQWERDLEQLAQHEGKNLNTLHGGVLHERQADSFEGVLMEAGVAHMQRLMDEEVEDMQARATVMLDIVDEEQRLAALEKKSRDAMRKKAWEEKAK